jgi:HAD superfamily hydrolase (TIGR01509 family)
MIEAVIFDLDGLLADTERLHSEAWRRTLAADGIVVSEEEYAEHWIRAGLGIAEYLEIHRLAVDLDGLRRRKAEAYYELVGSSACAMPGAIALVAAVHGRKRTALATSSYLESATAVLARVDVGRYLEVIATYESAPRRKPHPDVFLYVADRLGVAPASCVAIDDAEKGILAAHAAGMKSIAVPTPDTRHNDFSKATLVVPSLEAISLEIIDSLG